MTVDVSCPQCGGTLGDRIFLVGGLTGKDGIHGGSASSMELSSETPQSIVQSGDPIVQKRMADFLIESRDLGLHSGLTDCGAGGIGGAVLDLIKGVGGCEIDISLVPLKHQGLKPWEIVISESQQRMIVSVPIANKTAFYELAARRSVLAIDIGSVNQSDRFTVFWKNRCIADMSCKFLFNGCPIMELEAIWEGVPYNKNLNASNSEIQTSRGTSRTP